MATPPNQYYQLRWVHASVCLASFVGGLVLIGLGCVAVDAQLKTLMIVAGAFLLLVATMFFTAMPMLLRMEATFARQLSELRELRQSLAKQSDRLDVIAVNTALSDAAKSLSHRQQELDALTSAIREEIHHGRWESSNNLVHELERRFGASEQAAAIREELDTARGDAIHEKLSEAIEKIENFFRPHDWEKAQIEIDRLHHALPDNARVAGLIDRMKILKEQHKQELMQAWEEATKRSDTDHAIEILRELDQYLSPAEAHALQSSARHVFKEKLLQLGIQFRFAVNEKRWADAVSTGLVLVRDFPNARMTNEVREALDTLRERARQQGMVVPEPANN
ncbi:MAG: hypothetical protein IH987_00710 [Planctomycetes bacterium]|nr:hypothetical protein [Planctomycetota bacterium]